MAAEGFLTADDLAAHRGEWGEPIATTYRGFTVYETPPPTQGITALIGAQHARGLPAGDAARCTRPSTCTCCWRSPKLAYADRDRWIGDPAHGARARSPAMLDKDVRRRAGAKLFDPAQGEALHAGRSRRRHHRLRGRRRAGQHRQRDPEPVQRVRLRAWCRRAPGFCLQNRGRHFTMDPAHPSVLAPGKRPFHTLMASIITRDDRPVMGFATMGGNGQAMFHVQVLTNVFDYGLDIQEAIERPRFLIGAFLPDEPADLIRLESRVPRGCSPRSSGGATGSRAAPELFYRVGHAHGVTVSPDGVFAGGADPRGDGVALGF